MMSAAAQKPPADPDLVAAALQGDRRAFSQLVARYRDAAVGVVYRMTGDLALSEDAAQEAFLKAWQRLYTYKPEYPFRSWICGIATHVALDVLRRERPSVDLDAVVLESPTPNPEAAVESRQRSEQVRQAVLALPEASRAVLVLREYENLSYTEISRSLHIPVGTVMSRLNYARKLLRASLALEMETQ